MRAGFARRSGEHHHHCHIMDGMKTNENSASPRADGLARLVVVCPHCGFTTLRRLGYCLDCKQDLPLVGIEASANIYQENDNE